MKLGNMLDELRYGKDFVETNQIVESMKNYINEDYNIYMVSKKVDDLLKECNSAKTYTKRLSRASKNYSDFEKKLMEGIEISQIYGRMKIDSIVNDINEAIKELENRVTFKEANQEALAHSIATLKYGVSAISEATESPVIEISESNEALNVIIDKYSTLLAETVEKTKKKDKKPAKKEKTPKDDNPKFEAKESDVVKDFVQKPTNLISTPEKAPAGKENKAPTTSLIDFIERNKK